MWYKVNNENNLVTLHVTVKPNAKKTEIVGIINNSLKINLHAPAIDNKANIELISYLQKLFRLKKSDIKILQGEKNKSKTLQLFFSEQLQEFLQNHSY